MAQDRLDIPYDLRGQRIWVAGHAGMVGSALVRRLASEDCEIIISARDVDLRDQCCVRDWMSENRPDVVILAAAKVGGIGANSERFLKGRFYLAY